MSLFKVYIDKGTFVHRLHPAVKMGWFAAIVLLAWAFNRWEWTFVIFLWALAYATLARLPMKKIFGPGFLLVIWTVIIGIILWPAFLKGGSIVFRWGWFEETDIALSVALAFGFRVGACIIAAFAWLMTTRQREMIEGLTDVHVPYQFSFGIMLALRYAPVLLGEIARIREVQKARAFNWNRGPILRRLRAFAENTRMSLVPVFNRMLSSVNQIALCLDSKGVDFSKPPKRRKVQFTKSDKAFLGFTIAATIFLMALRFMGYGWISMIVQT